MCNSSKHLPTFTSSNAVTAERRGNQCHGKEKQSLLHCMDDKRRERR